MKIENIRTITLPKIGFGTWTIGGRDHPDTNIDEQSMLALDSALELGYTHFDTAEYYAAGHAEELLGQAIRNIRIRREELFITSKVSPEHLQYDDVISSCANSLRRLQMDYLDLYLIHWPIRGMRLDITFLALNQLVREGRVKNLGVSNFSLKLLQQAQKHSETPLLTNQVSYSLPDRAIEKNGVLDYCQRQDILLTAYSPVKRRNIRGNKKLLAIAKARGATPQQIALAWLVRQPKVVTIPMSFNPAHQLDNYLAADIELTDMEIEQLG